MKARYRFVFLDVDSTLVSIEGIDVLGHDHPEIATLTAAAMNGELPLDDVYGRRLELIRPTRTSITSLAARYCDSLLPGAAETVHALQSAGAQVHLVTAAIAQSVAPLAARLGIPARAVHAVDVLFDGDSYGDFNRRSPLVRPGGKELVIRDVRARAHGNAALVGDGVSDLEAAPAVDLFIGFGGVVTRQRVREHAAAFAAGWVDVRRRLIDE